MEGLDRSASAEGWFESLLVDFHPHLDECYRELRPFLPDCRFGDCTHTVEPDCAVRAAVEAGRVSAARYDSYLRLREELGEAPKSW